jgi:hypothetical protein
MQPNLKHGGDSFLILGWVEYDLAHPSVQRLFNSSEGMILQKFKRKLNSALPLS